MRATGYKGVVFVLSTLLLVVMLAPLAQSRTSLLDQIGRNATAAAGSETSGGKDCDIVFCTETQCNTAQRGWEACYCCEPLKPNAPCYRTRDACRESCPICGDPKQ
ncbi:hypothetical protein EJB05_46567 [Eragrostis curvula]|uniref:Bowman-Birk serine protease inhibitors family domain-containing protein n=1 Tax=Eragrostis curvula TaxID=38414 RepID=A0A5J9TQF6_9POAL|nr:hypothetical protein EJB05_46567 [Eragrostis curvula]